MTQFYFLLSLFQVELILIINLKINNFLALNRNYYDPNKGRSYWEITSQSWLLPNETKVHRPKVLNQDRSVNQNRYHVEDKRLPRRHECIKEILHYFSLKCQSFIFNYTSRTTLTSFSRFIEAANSSLKVGKWPNIYKRKFMLGICWI